MGKQGEGKITVNGVGGDISSRSAYDPEWHPTPPLDPRYTERPRNWPSHRNTIKGRSGSGTRLTKKAVSKRDAQGRFVKQPKKLDQATINRRGKYGY